MTKVSRTFRLDQDLSKKLDKICVRHGDVTWHLEQALNGYGPIKLLTDCAVPKPSKLGISPVPIKGGLVEGDRLFELFWAAGMRKVNKKKAKPLFLAFIKKAGATYEEAYTNNLIQDIQMRLNSNQLGFAEMHPTTYLNGERWNDEVITNDQSNRPNGAGGTNKLSAVERVRATNEANRAARADTGGHMANTDGHLRELSGEPVRAGDAGGMDSVIEGSYTTAD